MKVSTSLPSSTIYTRPLTFQLFSTQGYFGDRCGDHAFFDVQEIKYKFEKYKFEAKFDQSLKMWSYSIYQACIRITTMI